MPSFRVITLYVDYSLLGIPAVVHVNRQGPKSTLCNEVGEIAAVGATAHAYNTVVFLAFAGAAYVLENSIQSGVAFLALIVMLRPRFKEFGAMATMTGVIESYLRVGSVHHTPAALLITSNWERIRQLGPGPWSAGRKRLFKKYVSFFRIVNQHASSFILVHK